VHVSSNFLTFWPLTVMTLFTKKSHVELVVEPCREEKARGFEIPIRVDTHTTSSSDFRV
jgi:hypothetical protein